MRRAWSMCLTSLLVAACAGAGIKGEIAPLAPISAAIIHRPYDQVFESVVRYLADRDLTIETAEHRRGVIATVPFLLTERQRALWTVCAGPTSTPPGTGPVEARAVVNVLAHPLGDSTRVRVRMRVKAAQGSTRLTCHSTGFFESDVLNALARQSPRSVGEP